MRQHNMSQAQLVDSTCKNPVDGTGFLPEAKLSMAALPGARGMAHRRPRPGWQLMTLLVATDRRRLIWVLSFFLLVGPGQRGPGGVLAKVQILQRLWVPCPHVLLCIQVPAQPQWLLWTLSWSLRLSLSFVCWHNMAVWLYDVSVHCSMIRLIGYDMCQRKHDDHYGLQHLEP